MQHHIFNPIPINQLPDLTMTDITKKLFNNEFLSDVKFTFQEEMIKSHSFELKKRSVIFQKKFPTTISTLYPAFYEVIRYLYTDECKILPHDRIAMLKLAIKYKISSLETKLINGLTYADHLEILEYSRLGEYTLVKNMMREWIQNELHANLDSKKLESLHPDILEEILSLEYIRNVTEDELFGLLQRWIHHQCELNVIPLPQRREHFGKFIRLIRFPAMSITEFTNCVKKDDGLFTKQDVLAICRHITMGADCTDRDWNDKPRLNSTENYRQIQVANRWESKFTVLSELIMRGLRFGFCNPHSNFVIRIKGINTMTRTTETLNFKFDKSMCSDLEMVVNLGEVIKLKPNYEYTVEITTSDGQAPEIQDLRNGLRPYFQDDYLNLCQSQIVRKLDSSNLFEIIYHQAVQKTK